MWIQELNIKNFGKFSDRRIILKPGINLIYGENESGKSTLHAFIRGCLYGIRKMRGRASKTDVYSRYQPWENSGYYAGVVRFVCGGKVFRLERDFTRGVQAGVLVCETDGELLSLENGDLEMLLGNVGEVAFDNTVSIGQMHSETDEGLAVELKNHMANYENTGGASIRVEKTLLMLKEQKKQLEKKAASEQKKEDERLRKISDRIFFLREAVEKEKQELERSKSLLTQIPNDENRPVKGAKQQGFLSRLIQWLKNIFAGLFGRKRVHNEAEEMEEINRYTGKRAKLLGKIEHLENQIQEKEIQIRNAIQESELQKELQQTDGKRRLLEDIQACNLAMARIQEVVAGMQIDTGRFLKKRTSEIFSALTDGKYRWVEVQENLTMMVHSSDRVIPVEQLSRGTIWQLYFALRMAANEVLCQEESLPVILDDAFVMYDDVRLARTLDWLAKQKKQVLIFTCQKREKEMLMSGGTAFHEVVI